MALVLSSLWQSLPTSSGVYIYKNASGNIIYIGKAKNLRSRVRSYFQSPVKLGPKTAKLVSEITSLEYIEVGSEVEALLLEARLIQKHQPQFNIDLKDGKTPYYIHVTARPEINHIAQNAIAGPFLNSFIPKSILKQFRRIAPYCLSKNPKKPCFYSHLGLCNPCPGNPNFDRFEYLNNILRLKKLLKGKFKQIFSQLKRDMDMAAKNQNFETAAKLRDRIKNLEYLLHKPVSPDDYIVNPNLIQDQRHEALTSLIENCKLKIENLARIEMYDIANLAGTAATGAMSVAINGQVNPKYYRHFTIKTSGPDDVHMLKEMLERRLKRTDWPKPDLIVLDGGKPQLSIFNSQFTIPVIGLAKKNEIIYTLDSREIKLERNDPGLRLLQHLRDEAHRFSRRLHHKHRKL